MAEEKRVKLGVDLGELSNQLLQVNSLVEQNYNKAIKGQNEYNTILEKSIELLKKQTELVGQSSPQNTLISDNINSNSDQSSSANTMRESDIRRLIVLVDRIRGTMNRDSSSSEENSEIGNIVETISDNISRIWNRYAEGITSPIPVNVINTPLAITTEQGESGEGGGETQTSEESDNQNTSSSKKQNKQPIWSSALNQSAAGFANKDPNYLLAGFIGAIPFVGQGLAAVFSRLLSSAENLDNAQAKAKATMGQYSSPMFGFTDIGLSDAEALEKQAAYYKANIRLNRKDLEFEKGYNINSGIIDALLRSTRQEKIPISEITKNNIETLRQTLSQVYRMSDSESSNFIYNGNSVSKQEYISLLKDELEKQEKNTRSAQSSSVLGVDYLLDLTQKGKISAKEVRGYSEDYLKILIDLNQKQLEITGETNSILNSDIISSIARLDTKLGDPTILSKVISNIQSGLIQASSPQLEALQYFSLSKTNPNASIWEMELMREDPFGKGRGYFSNYLNSLLQTGNINDIKFNVKNAFGLSARQTEYLVNGILKAQEESSSQYLDEQGKFSLQKYLEIGEIDLGGGYRAKNNISQNAAFATSSTQQLLAESENLMAKLGTPVLEGTTELASGVLGFIDKVPSYISEVGSWIEDFGGKLSETISNSIDSLGDKIVNKISGRNSYVPSVIKNDTIPSNSK